MFSFLAAVFSGAFMSIQGVMNTRLSEKIGLLESNAFVQGSAFVLSALAVLMFGKGSFSNLPSVPKGYLLGGGLGLLITVTVMLSIKGLSPTIAISVILIAQLITAAVIDATGFLGTERIPLHFQQLAGILVMIAGVILFKWQGG